MSLNQLKRRLRLITLYRTQILNDAKRIRMYVNLVIISEYFFLSFCFHATSSFALFLSKSFIIALLCVECRSNPLVCWCVVAVNWAFRVTNSLIRLDYYAFRKYLMSILLLLHTQHFSHINYCGENLLRIICVSVYAITRSQANNVYIMLHKM